MKKTAIAALAAAALTMSVSAYAATATWTGKMRSITTVTYQSSVECEYNYSGRMFWRTFVGSSCPASVDVQ